MNSALELCSVALTWSDPEWLQVIVGALGVFGSLLLAYIAIVGKEKFVKLKFSYEVSKIDQKLDDVTLEIFRIKIKNLSKRPAKDVITAIVEISDKKNSRFYKRKDFIHMPLEWTHYPLDKKTRNIAAGEEAYIDIGQYDLFDPGLRLHTNPRVNAEQLNSIMNDARFTLRLTEKHGYTEEIKFDFKMHLSGGGLETRGKTKVLSKG